MMPILITEYTNASKQTSLINPKAFMKIAKIRFDIGTR
jgi:hypothetical protein